MAVGSERCARDTSGRCIRVGVLVLLAAIVTVGCARASASTIEPPPTYIPQPTPDPTMAVVIQGGGSPVAYLPPLEMKGSPTPLPAVRPGSATGARPAAKPAPAAQATRETTPAREPAPVAKPAAPREPAPAAKPAPTATRAPANSGGSGSGSSGSGSSGGGQPAIINPNTALPGGGRPNPTPGR